MKKKILLITILLTLFLSSCGVLPLNKNGSLNGTSWTLISYNGTDLLPETAMTAFFEDREINGSASCNHYFGSYTAKGDQIQIEGLGWTEMACMDPEGIMLQEQQVMNLFSQAGTYSIEGQILQITTGSGEIMIFQQIDDRE
jgi:heat shock protein HslJ